jgi:hypothetical protein
MAAGSELLGAQDCGHEIKEKAQGDEGYDGGFHGRRGDGRAQRTLSQKSA